jgi:hypothetical protein
MDILAAILAYLGCVAGLVGALAIAFTVLVSAPDQPPSAAPVVARQSAAMAAKPAAPKVTMASAARPATQPIARPHGAATVTPEATPTPPTAAHAKALAVRAQKWRRFVQEERARRWAYQQGPDFESRFLGYAD